MIRVVGRFLFGKHLDGRARGDGSFWRRAVEADPHWLFANGSPWARAAGWHRSAARLAFVAALYGLWRARHSTEWALTLAGGPLLGLALWGAWRKVTTWRLRRELVRPLSSALAPFLGVAPGAVESVLSVRPDFEDAESGEHVGDLGLPDHWAATSDQKARLEEVIGARFAVDLRFAWRTDLHPMIVNFNRAPMPPAVVPLAEVLAELEQLPQSKVLLGRASDGSMRYWDRSVEDPHMATHGGSRRGKSSLLLSIAAQELARGGRVTAIDPKWVSLAPLMGVPGFTLLRDPRDVHAMWAGIAGFRAMIEDRFEALSHDPTLEFGYELLMIDEVSMFGSITQQVWRAEKDKSDPALAPMWADLAGCVWLGAQVRAHVVVAGQRLDYQLLGGVLPSLGVRLLAGYGPADYARLVGVPPFRRSQKPRGRFLVYTGDDPEFVQLVKADDGSGDFTTLRDFAMRGALRAAGKGSDLDASVGDATSDVLVGLADGARYTGLTEAAFRKRRERGPGVPGEFRVGNQPAWHRSDLDRWAGHSVAGEAAKQ